MPLSFSQALALAGQDIGDDDFSPEVDGLLILNSAGTYMAGAYCWSWLRSLPTTFALVDGQSKVAVPDLRKLIRGWFASNSTNTIQSVSQEVFAEYQTRARVTPPGGALAAVFYENDSRGVPVPSLHLWPEVAGEPEITILYEKRWPRVTVDSETIQIPEFMEPLYIEFVREVAQGYEESDVAKMDERISRLVTRATYQIAIKEDRALQAGYGPIRNGAVRTRGGRSSPYLNGTVQIGD